MFPDEPPALNHPLRAHKRVITTPQVAWYSEEANTDRRRTAAEIVQSALLGEIQEMWLTTFPNYLLSNNSD